MQGNQKAMREALEALVAYWDWNGYDAMRESRLKDMVRAALAETIRNCDVGTAEEQGERCLAQFNEWRRKADGKKLITAIMAWAQMPYTAEEGGAS